MQREYDRIASRSAAAAGGLSRSEADAFNKMKLDSIAEYQARLRNPRNDVWGKTLQEDTPEHLKQIFVDPFRRESARASTQRPLSPTLYKVKGKNGEDIITSIDRNTGESRVVYTGAAPQKPDPIWVQTNKEHNEMIKLRSKAVLEARTPREIEQAHKDLEVAKQSRDIFRKTPQGAAAAAAAESAPVSAAQNDGDFGNETAPISPAPVYSIPTTQAAPVPAVPASAPAAQVAPAPRQPEGYGFIGDPLNTRGLESGPENVFNTNTRYTRNGRIPKELMIQYIQDAGGDREKAAKFAIQSGYSLE